MPEEIKEKTSFQERVDRIEEELQIYLKKMGYRNATFQVITNCINREEIPHINEWPQGTQLLEHLDTKLRVPKRPKDKPFRMPIEGCYKIAGIGTVFCGRIESGKIP